MRNPIHRNVRRFAHVLIIWTLTANISAAQQSDSTQVGWGVTCLTDRVCELKNEIMQNDSVAARISIFRMRGHYWLQYTIPLGVDIQRGIQIAADGGAPLETTLDNCTAFGCTGQIDLTPEIIDAFKVGSALNIYFVNPAIQDTFVIAFSLTGFTDGFAALTQ